MVEDTTEVVEGGDDTSRHGRGRRERKLLYEAVVIDNEGIGDGVIDMIPQRI